jgi:hypothetical protein
MQLRGRAGRQGDPGETRFATSPDDELAALAPPAAAAAQGQATAERLDRERRDEVRATEAVTDRLHEQLYSWRRRTATATTLDEDLADAAIATAASLVRRAPWPPSLAPLHIPRWKRRHPLLVDHLNAALEERRAVLGETLWMGAAQLVLQTLLVVLWADELDRLDHQKSLSRIAPAFEGASSDWSVHATHAYKNFVEGVQQEWVRQLLALSVVDQVQPREYQPPVDIAVPALPARPPVSDPELHGQWDGWSFNAFVRRHFGTKLPEPPLVLVIDNFGDTPNRHGLRIQLDLDDPTATLIFLPRR